MQYCCAEAIRCRKCYSLNLRVLGLCLIDKLPSRLYSFPGTVFSLKLFYRHIVSNTKLWSIKTVLLKPVSGLV